MFYSNEYHNWKDQGCQLHPSCLDCPEERCALDEPRGIQLRRKSQRLRDIITLTSAGMTTQEAAERLCLSRRTVQRYLANLPS